MDYLQTFLKNNSSGGQHGSHYMYWVPIKVFNQLPIKIWKYNRPPDKDRVAEIHQFMKESNRMDGIIYLACIDHNLFCYESNHRREALQNIDEISDILVDILWDANDEIVKSEFTRLNKCVSVPELYFAEEDTLQTFDKVRECVEQFCTNFKSHKVSTNKPQRPNFNRDMVTDEFYRVMKENRISVDELADRITRLNREMATRDKSKLSEKIIKKCEESGLWLFAWSSKLNAKELL
jgi:hypothetical protein